MTISSLVHGCLCSLLISTGLSAQDAKSAADAPQRAGQASRDALFDVQRGVLETRGGRELRVERGYIRVPETRHVKGGAARRIELHYVRVRSPLEKPGVPVFILAGGPGGSSARMVESYARGGGHGFLRALGGDLVGLDQRGVGKSRPNLTSMTRYAWKTAEAGVRASMLARMRDVARAEAASWAKKGVDLRGYTTRESVDDLDALRRALGYEKIALWGGSYGSHFALAMIRYHEASVARAVLIGPEGPDHTVKLPSQTHAGLEKLAELVRASELGEAMPDLVASVRKLLARLGDKPVEVELEGGGKIGVSKFDVQRKIANAIGLASTAVQVPRAVAQMLAGNFSMIADDLSRERQFAGPRSAMQMVMDHASGMSPARAARTAAERDRFPLSDAVNFPVPELAKAWGAPDLGAEFRGALASSLPVLFLVGDLDSRTPIRNAKELMKDLPNAQLVVVENAGHDLRWTQREVMQVWRDFLAGKAPAVARVEAPALRFWPLEGELPGRKTRK